MEIKLIALDLDGTALRSDNTLSPAVARAIEAAGDMGIEIIAASGRPYCSMPESVQTEPPFTIKREPEFKKR